MHEGCMVLHTEDPSCSRTQQPRCAYHILVVTSVSLFVIGCQVVIDFFTFRLDSAKPEVPHAQGDWSVARVLELVQSYSQVSTAADAPYVRQ